MMGAEQDNSTQIKIEYVDRKTLRTLRERFFKINQGRITRTSQGLNENQRTFFQSLALILSVNHPLLPGYVSKETPAGISGYTPSKLQIQAVKKLFRTFEHKKAATKKVDIHSVFLMGSTGTVAHAGGSDMDIWVCHRPDLDAASIALLIKKLDQISAWAKKEVALDVCFFPMNADNFRNGVHESEVDDEDCGSAQHYLLLDEFYRSGLLLEGRYPMWWLMSPEIEDQYDQYVQFILSRKFITDEEAIDFGSIPSIPAGEFVGAGIWQLYKAIDSPYKSVVKILLTEAYAAEHPNVESVSLIYKTMVHSGEDDLNAVDPYMLVFEKIESYLKSLKADARLDLARQCFYLKTKVDVSKIKKNESNWRRIFMYDVIKEWGWTDQFTKELDSRRDWNISDVYSRKKLLVREMNSSYRFLLSFAKKFRTEININTSDITLLGRKLHAAFEKKRGKIDKANPKIAPDISEEALTFLSEQDLENQSAVWSLFLGTQSQIIPEITKPIKRSRSLVELLAWSYFNQVYINGTSIQLKVPNMSVANVTSTYDILEKHFPEQHGSPELDAFHAPAALKKILIMVEFANPNTYSSKFENGFNYDDPLNQKTSPPSSINMVDCIIQNTWQETICAHYDGSESLVQCLVQLLVDLPPPDALLSIDVEVGSKRYGDIIKPRIERILGEFFVCFHKHKHSNNARFIIEVGNQLYGIQPRKDQVFTKKFRNIKMLAKWLNEPQPVFSPVIFESFSQAQSSLSLTSKYNTPDTIQVFYEIHGNQAEVIIFDELGSLFTYTTGFSSDQHFIAHTYRFLRAVMERQELGKMELIEADLSRDEVEFFEIFTDFRKNTLIANKQDIFHHIERESFVEIMAILDQTTAGATTYRIFCDDKEFSQLEYGSQLYHAVAKHIQQMRGSSGSKYPIYLTDIDLSGMQIANNSASELQVSQFLHYKHEIESNINNELHQLD